MGHEAPCRQQVALLELRPLPGACPMRAAHPCRCNRPARRYSRRRSPWSPARRPPVVPFAVLVLRTLLGLAALGAHAPVPRGAPMPPPANPAPAFALRTPDGRTVLSGDDVLAYSW